MDMGEVLIITPCVGVDLCACVRKREKERGERERGGNNVPAPPPTAWICHKTLGKERGRSREGEEGEMYGDRVKEEEECVCVCPSISVFKCHPGLCSPSPANRERLHHR